jgi:hypothetical protein
LARNGGEFCQRSIFHIPCSYLTCRKILRHGAGGFTFLSNEVVLRIFEALKYLTSSAGFAPANFGSSVKHDNHQTTEADNEACKLSKNTVIKYGQANPLESPFPHLPNVMNNKRISLWTIGLLLNLTLPTNEKEQM